MVRMFLFSELDMVTLQLQISFQPLLMCFLSKCCGNSYNESQFGHVIKYYTFVNKFMYAFSILLLVF